MVHRQAQEAINFRVQKVKGLFKVYVFKTVQDYPNNF